MNNLSKRFAEFVIRYRALFIFLCLFLTAFFLFGLRKLNFQTNLGDFIPQKHSYVIVHNKLTQIFGGLNQVSIALEVKEGDIFNKDTLGKVIRITNCLYLMDGINAGRVTSLSARKIKHVTANAEGFRVERVLREIPENEGQMQKLK